METILVKLDGKWIDMPAADYAAMWGCDACYDKPPRLPGDGAMFYNYAVEGWDSEFLARFADAIRRTIAEVRGREADDYENTLDILALKALLKIVEGECRELYDERLEILGQEYYARIVDMES